MIRKIGFSFLIIFVFILSCKSDFPKQMAVKTVGVSNLTFYSAIVYGRIIDKGDGITEYGFCWGISPLPTIIDNRHFFIYSGTFTDFNYTITGLLPLTKYYLRAFVTDGNLVIYGEETTFTTLTDECGSLADIDGNTYNTIRIGTQCWMAENLKTSKLSNGYSINNIEDEPTWSTAQNEAWCYYMNNSLNNITYGKLYNWFAVNSTNNLCPIGWHVPTKTEWQTLIANCGGSTVAGSKLKEAGTAHWSSPNPGADNSSGFTALPAGYRASSAFRYIGYNAHWWTSTEYDADNAWYFGMNNVNSDASGDHVDKNDGFSVRCIKD